MGELVSQPIQHAFQGRGPWENRGGWRLEQSLWVITSLFASCTLVDTTSHKASYLHKSDSLDLKVTSFKCPSIHSSSHKFASLGRLSLGHCVIQHGDPDSQANASSSRCSSSFPPFRLTAKHCQSQKQGFSLQKAEVRNRIGTRTREVSKENDPRSHNREYWEKFLIPPLSSEADIICPRMTCRQT